MNIKIMRARYAGTCFRCKQRFPIGEEIAWFSNSHRVAHFFCHLTVKHDATSYLARAGFPMKFEFKTKPENKPEQKRAISRLMMSCYQQKFEVPSGLKTSDAVPRIWDHWTKGGQGYFPSRSSTNPRIEPFGDEIVVNVRGIFDTDAVSEIHDNIRFFFKNKLKEKVEMGWGKKPPPVDLPSYNEEPSNNVIAKRGIELEGGWDAPPRYVAYDGSVRFPFDVLYRGEVRTTPVPIHDESWQTEFFNAYPKHINESCGMHVHFSFPTMGVYAGFVNRRFQSWLMKGLDCWYNKTPLVFGTQITNDDNSSFKSRISGNNHYCGFGYYPYDQLNARRNGPARYCAVNYCYSKHKTFEVRVLPMFSSPHVGRAAVLELTRLINLWGSHMCPKLRHGIVLNETVDAYGEK